MASSSKSPFKLSIDPKFAEKVGIGALQCVACLGFFFVVRVTIASRTSAVCGFLPARALAPVLEQALDDTIHVGLLPAPNRRLRHPNLALDGIRPEAATRRQYNACVCDDLRSSAYARFSSMAALMGRYKHGVKSTRFSGRLTPSGRGGPGRLAARLRHAARAGSGRIARPAERDLRKPELGSGKPIDKASGAQAAHRRCVGGKRFS